MKHSNLILISLFLFSLFLTSCEKDDSPEPQPSGNESTVYDVTLTDNTVYIDSIEVNQLIEIDTANHIYYFEGADPEILNLEKGDILLLHGIALRKVFSVSTEGNTTRIETEYATLNEAILDGEISWNREIDFNEGVVPEVVMNGKNIKLKSATEDGYEFEFTYGKFKYRIKFVFSDKRADLEFEITKELVKPVNAKFKVTGFIENFYSKTEMKFENSKLTQFGQKNSNIKGELSLNLIVAGSGRDEVVFELPVILLKFPTTVGAIPVDINLKVLFLMNCVVPVDGSSRVEVTFSYNSTTGVKYDGTNVTADASIGDHNMDKKTAETGASSAIGANFGLAFPRLEIAAFDESVVPWIHTAFLIGGDYTFTPPCQQARSQFIGACGIDFSFLGLKYSVKKTLWQEEKILLRAGECPEN